MGPQALFLLFALMRTGQALKRITSKGERKETTECCPFLFEPHSSGAIGKKRAARESLQAIKPKYKHEKSLAEICRWMLQRRKKGKHSSPSSSLSPQRAGLKGRKKVFYGAKSFRNKKQFWEGKDDDDLMEAPLCSGKAMSGQRGRINAAQWSLLKFTAIVVLKPFA